MQRRCQPKLSTGYPQDELEDLLDVPPFFDDDEQEMGSTRVVHKSEAQVFTKPGVVLPRRSEMAEGLRIAAARGDVVTSGQDGAHLANSLHYEGLAFDLRPSKDLAAQVFRYRNSGYTVLVEGLRDPDTGKTSPLTKGVGTAPHLHVSFDPEGRRV